MKNLNNKAQQAPIFNGLVLAGGKSSRMGRDKALLCTNKGITLKERCQHLLRSVGATQVFISSNNPQIKDAVADRFNQSGPVAGIDAALNIASDRPLLILPVDMPLISAELLARLVQFGQKNVSSAHFNEQCLPLYIFDSAAAAKITEELLSDGQCPSVWSFCRALVARELEAGDASGAFFNANNPEQWQECQHQLEESTTQF